MNLIIKKILMSLLITEGFLFMFLLLLMLPFAMLRPVEFSEMIDNYVEKLIDRAEYIALYDKEKINKLRSEWRTR